MGKCIGLYGIGGQGVLTVSKLLASGLMEAGYDIKMSEIHGLGQRGGNVSATIRYGEHVYSPLAMPSEMDVVVCFEESETLRGLNMVKRDGVLISNPRRLVPAHVLQGKADYPEGSLDFARSKIRNFKLIDSYRIADDLGNSRSQNFVMLGALAGTLKLAELDWAKIIKDNFRSSLFDISYKAFEAGIASAQEG